MNEQWDHLLSRAEQQIDRIEAALPRRLTPPDWSRSVAYRYRKRGAGYGALEPVLQECQSDSAVAAGQIAALWGRSGRPQTKD